MTTIDGKGHGGVQGHIHLTHMDTPTLYRQALLQSDLGCAATQLVDLQCSVLENDELKRQIQELLEKWHIRLSLSLCGTLIVLVQKKDDT